MCRTRLNWINQETRTHTHTQKKILTENNFVFIFTDCYALKKHPPFPHTCAVRVHNAKWQVPIFLFEKKNNIFLMRLHFDSRHYGIGMPIYWMRRWWKKKNGKSSEIYKRPAHRLCLNIHSVIPWTVEFPISNAQIKDEKEMNGKKTGGNERRKANDRGCTKHKYLWIIYYWKFRLVPNICNKMYIYWTVAASRFLFISVLAIGGGIIGRIENTIYIHHRFAAVP